MGEEDIDLLLEKGITEPKKEVKKDEDSGRKRNNSSSPEDRRRDRSRRSRRHRSASSSDRSSSRERSRKSSRRHGSSRRRHRSRSRSSNRSRRRDDRSKRRRSNSRSRDRRRSSKEKEKSPPRARSTSAERAERKRQLELMELTRDHRTVFVGQLQRKVLEKDLLRFFSRIGKVERVTLLKDKRTDQHKGIGYVEMNSLEDVPKVLLLNGQIPDFQVFPVMIKTSEAEKNFAAKKDSVAAQQAAYGSNSSAASRIYCGNLHTNITEEDLKSVFGSFGEVLSVHINRDETGRSKGFGFIQFRSSDEANFALSKGNGLELAGNYLKLGCVNDGGGATTNFQSGWKLEDDEEIGMQMNSQSRTALMAKLAGGSGADFIRETQKPAPSRNKPMPTAPIIKKTMSGETPPIEGSESFCFVLKNMYDPALETEDGWDIEIKEDVEEECSKFGTVLHSYIAKEKSGGLVYILLNTISGAVQAAKTMHGRWFSQRQITVRFMSSQEYVGMFPQARSAVQEAKESSAQE